jgi:hypothetical protein
MHQFEIKFLPKAVFLGLNLESRFEAPKGEGPALLSIMVKLYLHTEKDINLTLSKFTQILKNRSTVETSNNYLKNRCF